MKIYPKLKVKDALAKEVGASLVNDQSVKKSSKTVTTNTNSLDNKKLKLNARVNKNQALPEFLQQYKVGKGEEYTHTSMGYPLGSFNIPLTEKATLIDLVNKYIFVDKKPCYLTEKPPQTTIIRVDLDYRFHIDCKTRQFDLEYVKRVVKIYNEAIEYYLEVPRSAINVVVLQRDEPYSKNGITKDGIHLMYPSIACDVKIQHLIREHVLKHGQDILNIPGLTNNLEDVVDKAIISKNNWLMYGCHKPNVKPYKIQTCYTYELEEGQIDTDSHGLVGLLSIIDISPDYIYQIKDSLKETLTENTPPKKSKTKEQAKTTKVVKSKKKIQSRETITIIEPKTLDYTIEDIEHLVSLLNHKRSDDAQTWYCTGQLLYNLHIESQFDLLPVWIKFSKISSKFKDGICESKWKQFDVRDEASLDKLRFVSLKYWASEDDPEKYKEWELTKIKEDLKLKWDTDRALIIQNTKNMIQMHLSSSSYKVALVVATFFKSRWLSIDRNLWYYFDYSPSSRKWVKDIGGEHLISAISAELRPIYISVLNHYRTMESSVEIDEKCEILEKTIKCLIDITSKQKYIREAWTMMENSTFESRLDNTNLYLTGFDNGFCYDAENNNFRKMQPDDMVSMSVGYDYIKTRNPELEAKVKKFFADILTQDDKREYFMSHLSQVLEAKNNKSVFLILTGIGSNGKGIMNEMITATLGQYADSLSPDYLTTVNQATDRPQPGLYNVVKCRWVVVREAETHDNLGRPSLLSSGWIKGITSKSDPIRVRQLNQNPISVIPHFILVGEFNALPDIKDKSNGIKRRFKNIVCDTLFTSNPDPNKPHQKKMNDTIGTDFPNWRMSLFHILTDYYQEKLGKEIIEPECVKVSSEELINYDEPVTDWFNLNVIKDETGILTLKEVKENFNTWFDQSDYDKKSKPILKMIKSKVTELTNITIIKHNQINKKDYHNYWLGYRIGTSPILDITDS